MEHADAGHAEPTVEDLALISDLDHGELGRLLRIRVPDLVAYQDRAYAERYVEVVRRAARAEEAATPGQTAVAEAVARNLYKLMAYKDEYEVARLHLEGAARLQVEGEVGGDVKISYNLHPPMLRAVGLQQKIRLGPWFTPALRTLERGKRLRGTALDPFGWAKVRRVERQLIEEYRQALDAALDRLTAENHADVAQLAGLPDLVRGYEEVKLGNVERFRTELTRLQANLGR
jgi:indolepyruvate ferredoxin oxidoreductase